MAQLDRSSGLVGNAAFKYPCRAATTANITLSAEQTIDGIACVDGDRILVKNQTTGSENGIWVVSTGSWNRSDDCDGSYDVTTGTMVRVTSGTTNANSVWKLDTTGTITIGSSTLTFTAASVGGFDSQGMADFIHAATTKATPVNADEVGIWDSVSGLLNRLSFTNLKAFLKTYYDTLYAALAGSASQIFAYKGKPINLLDYGVVGDDVTDDTTAWQSAINAATTANRILYAPAPSVAYKITDTLSCPTGTKILGEHVGAGNPGGGTRINFAPTSAKSLFVPSGAPALYRVGYSFENLAIFGNSTTSAGNSIYAFDTYGINKSRFKDILISGFRTGVRCYGTINNRFEFLQIVNTYVESVIYNGGTPTTDVWEQCYFGTSPVGIQTSGDSVAIRFNDCIFESITTYGANLVKEAYGWIFSQTYVEDTPSDNVATNAMFRVGFDGTTLAATPQLTIIGGYFGGRNAGLVGAMLDVDYTDGIYLGGFFAARYTNIVRTSANTQTKQIVAGGWTSASISAQVSDTTKVDGFYADGVFNGGNRNMQNAFFNTMQCGIPSMCKGNSISAGGSAGVGALLSSTANFGVFFGSGAPTLSAAKGSLYLRSDGSGVGDRMYVNTNGGTTWTAVTTVA